MHSPLEGRSPSGKTDGEVRGVFPPKPNRWGELFI